MLGNLFEGDGGLDDDRAPFPAASVTGGSSRNYYSSYHRKPMDKRVPNGFVGLLNQGATCYLNSLIQMMYMTPELKNDLYSLGLKDLGLESEPSTSATSTSLAPTHQQDNQNLNSLLEVVDNEYQSNQSKVNFLNEVNDIMENPTTTTGGPNIFSNEDVFGMNESGQTSNMDSFAEYDQDYVQSILAFGFEDYKVLAGLKKFPSSYQQEKLIDWILTANEEDFIIDNNNDNKNNSNNFNSSNLEEISCYPPLSPFDSAKFLDSGNDNDNFGAFSGNGFDNDNQNKAIILYDSNQVQNIFTMPTTTSTTSTTDKEIIDLTNLPSDTTTTITANTSSTNTTKQKKKGRIIAYELQRLFSMLQKGDVTAISTENLTRGFGWDSGEVVQQQDIHELNRILFDAVEHSLKGTSIQDLIINLYRGVLINRIECTNCGKIKDREEYFQDIPVTIKGFKTLEESLKSFVTPEVLDGDNKYFCEGCNERVRATIGVKMGKLPPVLTIPLRRFDFDLKRGSRVKITSKFKFPNTINMAKYTAEWSTYERDLENGLKPKKPEDQIYELFAVLIHSGGAYGGHYHSYIKDVSNQVKIENNQSKKEEENEQAKDQKDVNNNQEGEGAENEDENEEESSSTTSKSTSSKYSGWFDFNDSSVTIIPDSSIEKQFGNKHESAYMLVYRSKSLGESVTNSDIPNHLKKEIELFNLNLEEQRSKYETSINTMFVYPKFIGYDYKVVDGQLVEIKEAEKQKIRQESGRDDEEEQLKLDISTSVQDLFRMIREKYEDRFSQTEMMVIQEIQSVRDGRVQLANPLSSMSSLGIKKAGLREGERLLIWNGAKVHGVHTPPIRFCAKIYMKNKETNQVAIEERNLSVERESTFADVQQLLSKESGIPLDRLVIYNLVNLNLVPMENDMPHVPLADRIFSGTELYVEEKSENSSTGELGAYSKSVGESILLQEFERHRDKVHIFVNDRIDYDDNLSFSAPPPPHKLFVDTSATIYQLKQQIIDLIRPQLLPSQKEELVSTTIIRKTQVGGSPGTIISDDSFSLHHVGLGGGSAIIIERGSVTTPTITLNIIHSDLGKHTIQFSKKQTILELKQYILRLLGLLDTETNYILKTSDVFDQPDTILVDEDRTLEEGAIRNEDTLFIERGVLPSKDQLVLRFSIYRFNHVFGYTRFSLPASPALHLNPQFIPPTADLFSVTHIGDNPIDKKTTVALLKTMVKEWDIFRSLLSADELEKLDSQELDIRLWNDEKLLTTYSSMSKPLSKLHVQQESNIIIEFTNLKMSKELEEVIEDKPSLLTIKDKKIIGKNNLKKKDGGQNPPPILLYLHKRLPESQCFEYPPTQQYFNGKDIKDLKQFISQTTNIEPQYLKIFKYVTHSRMNPWRIIEVRRKKQSKKQYLKQLQLKAGGKEGGKDSSSPSSTTTISISDKVILDSLDSTTTTTTTTENVNIPLESNTTTTNDDTIMKSPNNESEDETMEDTDVEDGDDAGEEEEKLLPSSEESSPPTKSQSIHSDDTTSKNIPKPPPLPRPKKLKAAPQHNPNELRGKPWLFKDGDMIAYLDTREDPEENDKFALAMDHTSSFSGGSGSKYSFSGGSSHRDHVVKYRAPEVELKIQLDDY